ncbi:NAD-dependent deacetylase sirtuin-2 [Xylariomycetidae sp. FL0641]|nr:NAD-dependent deacetylase sirtuin-2 [Xylariomycetidae sp. FL0641]
MGQESSVLVSEDTPPQTLSERSLRAVAQLIKEGRAKRIVVMTGAGISTAAGIPDFRSPKTGLYHNLARLNLPHPEAVFEIDFFREDPRPFYVLARELYPGNFQPTLAHTFIALLARRKLLRMLFTQNIDCLERAAGVPPELIVEAHGSFATQRCIDCRTEFPDKEMREHVERGDAPTCVRDGCQGLVKPDIVFFGEQLPRSFFDNAAVPAMADLVFVIGTSLMVHPFAGLPRTAMERTPRVLFNMERVGDMGTRADDVLCLGPCDEGIRRLADELGWREELEEMWKGIVGEEEAKRQQERAIPKENTETTDDEDEVVQALARGMEEKLDISSGRADDGDESANLPPQDQDRGQNAVSPQDTSDVPAAPRPTTGDPAAPPLADLDPHTSRAAESRGEGAAAASQDPLKEESDKEKARQNPDFQGVASYVPVKTADTAPTVVDEVKAGEGDAAKTETADTEKSAL